MIIMPERLAAADRLATVLGLNMAEWWEPKAETYPGRVSKARVLEAVKEGVSPHAAENLATLKKDDLVVGAEERLIGKVWLPLMLRPGCTAAGHFWSGQSASIRRFYRSESSEG